MSCGRTSLCVWLCLIPSFVAAGDWPQIMGPTRNGLAPDEKLAAKWPAGGPKSVWQHPVGEGLSGVAVASGKVVVFHRQADEEIVEGLDATTGKSLWKTGFLTKYVPSFIDDRGPRTVPLIHDGRVYVYGANATLACVGLTDGKTVWKRNLLEGFKNKKPRRGEPAEGYFGFGTSPIVEGDKLLLNVGDDENEAGIMAFDLLTGETVWKQTKERASYSSPIAVTIGGQRQVIFATRLSLIAIRPSDGAKLWQHGFGQLGPAVVGANPVLVSDRIFMTASYGTGAVLIDAGKPSSPQLWSSDELLSSQYTTSIARQGLLIGIHGRQDLGAAALRCVDPATKKVNWSVDDFGYATLILAGDKLLALKTDGELVVGDATADGFKATASAKLFTKTTRALPALSNGRLFVRDTTTLKCFEVGER